MSAPPGMTASGDEEDGFISDAALAHFVALRAAIASLPYRVRWQLEGAWQRI
jgi:hypothetical protein